jgi:hypothetical protein
MVRKILIMDRLFLKNTALVLLFLQLLLPNSCFGWLNGTTWYGLYERSPASGFLQVPTAGVPISTTPKRPSLNELGINSFGKTNPFFQIGFKQDWSVIRLYGDYEYNHMTPSNTLKENLQTHFYFIGAGTLVETNIWFDLFRLGVARKINCCTNRCIFSLGCELAAFNFHYQFFNPNHIQGRNILHTTGCASLNFEQVINSYLTLNLNATSTLPEATDLQTQRLAADLYLKILTSKKITTKLLLGVGYQRIDFKDGQQMPNHLVINMAPIARVGLITNF